VQLDLVHLAPFDPTDSDHLVEVGWKIDPDLVGIDPNLVVTVLDQVGDLNLVVTVQDQAGTDLNLVVIDQDQVGIGPDLEAVVLILIDPDHAYDVCPGPDPDPGLDLRMDHCLIPTVIDFLTMVLLHWKTVLD